MSEELLSRMKNLEMQLKLIKIYSFLSALFLLILLTVLGGVLLFWETEGSQFGHVASNVMIVAKISIGLVLSFGFFLFLVSYIFRVFKR